MDRKPLLEKGISLHDFKDFYWYKAELFFFCKEENLDKSGGKLVLAQRIEKYLQTGLKELDQTPSLRKKSSFDWNVEELTNDTIITNSYKNTENVRMFFKGSLGDNFKFNVPFMNWMKTADGKSLLEACHKWTEIKESKKRDKSPKKITPQFEYNTYLRDFLKDNPVCSRNQAIECWTKKKSLRGDNKYLKSDLNFINN